MSFTSGSTGGSYKTGNFYGPTGGYGLTSTNPISFGGRPVVYGDQSMAGKWWKINTLSPYITVYFWKRTA